MNPRSLEAPYIRRLRCQDIHLLGVSLQLPTPSCYDKDLPLDSFLYGCAVASSGLPKSVLAPEASLHHVESRIRASTRGLYFCVACHSLACIIYHHARAWKHGKRSTTWLIHLPTIHLGLLFRGQTLEDHVGAALSFFLRTIYNALCGVYCDGLEELD